MDDVCTGAIMVILSVFTVGESEGAPAVVRTKLHETCTVPGLAVLTSTLMLTSFEVPIATDVCPPVNSKVRVGAVEHEKLKV